MSRLDRHVAMVQNKLALTRFVHALAWATTVWALALWVGILIDRIFRLRPPQVAWFIWGGLGAAVLVSVVYALMRRPTAHEAAVAIDEKLALKEKFSTALYARPLNDPFAQAAVKDAELTADNVSLHKRFPLVFPRQSLGTAGIGILVALTLAFMPTMDLFGKQAAREEENRQQQKTEETRKLVERALKVVVETETKGVADEEAIKQAKLDLQPLVNAPIKDPDKARRTVARALSELEQSLKKQMASNQRIADVEADSKAFKSLTPGDDEKGPVADAQRKIAKGEFGDAVDELSKAVSKFDKMDEKEQQKAAEQMQKMAQQLQQMANNPQQQQQAQQQMQQLGLTPQQAQKAQELMQQAAQGDKQAQQQLQQMAQKAMQQMNNGQGPTQQQQQQLQQMMKQMQAQANNQAQANQMAQAAQQMAQAMKQAQQQQGQPGAQQAGQQAQQQMAQAQQQMNQQLQAMQAMKADAQQVAAAQAAAAQAAADAAAACNNPGAGQGQGQGQQAGGQWGQGNRPGQGGNNPNNNQPGPNPGGGGIGVGDRTFKEQAPFQIKEEISNSPDIEGGKILASTMIKSKSIKGESKLTAAEVAPPPEQDETDEVEQERISRPAEQAVKKYFTDWQQESEK